MLVPALVRLSLGAAVAYNSRMRSVTTFFLIALSFVASSAVAAANFNMEFRCDEVAKNIDAVKTWTKSRSASCQMSEPASKDIGGGLCTADFTRCLPPEVIALDGTSPEIAGPNCWNLAMVMSGVLPSLRHSTAEEMAFFMKSPLCRPLGAGEKPQPGDIGALRANGKEVHGFMWISDTLVFSKNGDAVDQKYFLQSKAFMADGYQILQNAECAKTKDPEDCNMIVDSLRCQSLKSYVNDPKNATPKQISEALDQLEAADACLTPMQFNPKAFTKTQSKNLIQNIQVLAAMVESPEFKKTLQAMKNPDRDFISGSLIVRLNAMYHQVSLNKMHYKTCPTCEAVVEEISRSYWDLRDTFSAPAKTGK